MTASYPVSIQLYTVRDLMRADAPGTLRRLAEAGYRYIEGVPGIGMSPPDTKRFLDDLGLRVSANWAMPKPDSVQQIVENAQLFGYTLIVGCYGPDQFKTDAEIDRTAGDFQRAAELVAPHGLTMCYHNHWWEFDRTLADGRYPWDRLMERAPAVACQIDLYWASNFGAVDVPAVVGRYASRTPVVHAKDGPLVSGEPNVALGTGKADLVAAIRAADPAVLRSVVVEFDHCLTDLMAAVRQSHQWLLNSGVGRAV